MVLGLNVLVWQINEATEPTQVISKSDLANAEYSLQNHGDDAAQTNVNSKDDDKKYDDQNIDSNNQDQYVNEIEPHERDKEADFQDSIANMDKGDSLSISERKLTDTSHLEQSVVAPVENEQIRKFVEKQTNRSTKEESNNQNPIKREEIDKLLSANHLHTPVPFKRWIEDQFRIFTDSRESSSIHQIDNMHNSLSITCGSRDIARKCSLFTKPNANYRYGQLLSQTLTKRLDEWKSTSHSSFMCQLQVNDNFGFQNYCPCLKASKIKVNVCCLDLI